MVARLLICLYSLNAVLEFYNISRLRRLVYSFLLSKRNIKTAKRIHLAQTKKERFTLAYIKKFTIYPDQFRRWQRCWMIYVSILIPQLVGFVVANCFSAKVALIANCVIIPLKFVFSIFLSTCFSPSRIGMYDKRY